MSFQLTIAEGKEAGKEFVFDQPSVVIGRTSECEVVLYDPGVSRKHARIFLEGSLYFVEDMGSSNGTKVNGNVIRRHQLSDGDSVTLGPVVFKFAAQVVDELPPPEEGVADQSTRIVSADQVKRQRNKGVALLPEGADVDKLARTATSTLQAVKRNSDPKVPAAVAPKRAPTPGAGSPPARQSRSTSREEAAAGAPAPLARANRAARGGGDGDTENALSRPSRRGADDGETENALSRPSRSSGRVALSAAERARIRRESKGMVANLKIFWLEASTGTRAAVSVGMGIMVLGLLGTGWYFGLRDTTQGPAHPEPNVLVRRPVMDSFGQGEGVTWRRPDMKVFSFEFNAPVRAVVLVHFQARDVAQGEVVITVNGSDVGTVPADTLASSERSHEVVIPPSTLKKGEPNQIIFDNTRNPPGDEDWRIWNVWVETALLPELPPDQLLAEANNAFQRAQFFFERRDVGAENRYMAWKTFRESWLMLEAHPEPKPELYLLARDKVKETQLDLDRTCAKLLLEEESYFNQKDWNGARSTLDHVKSYFPNPDQPCPFRAEQKRAEHGL